MALSTPASDTSLPTPGGAAPAALPSTRAVRGSSLYRDAWRRLLRNKARVRGGRPAPRPRTAAVRASSLYRDAWRRLLRNKLAVAGGVTVILLCLIAIFADFLAPFSYTKPNFGRLNEFPSREFPLGTDQLGRDQLSRIIYG